MMTVVDASALLKPLYPKLTWRRATEERVVYLTFDDGPHPELTMEVLDILDEFDFKGTFFTVGANMVKYPEIVDELIARGHGLGNHTFSHSNGFRTEYNAYLQDVKRWSDRRQSRLFRPPYGRIKRRQINAIRDDYEIVMWSLLSWDFQRGIDTEKVISKMKQKTQSGDIAVFHDSEKASDNMRKLLRPYCEFLKREGFRSQVL